VINLLLLQKLLAFCHDGNSRHHAQCSANEACAALIVTSPSRGGFVDLQIRVVGRKELDELSSLWQWLQREQELRKVTRLVEKKIKDTELGGGPDYVSLALGTGGAGGLMVVLARALTTWLQSRRSEVTVRINQKDQTVELSVRSTDPLPLLQKLIENDDRSQS
jgi:hypothetical protein